MSLFAYNADIKYPLSDFHEETIPNDLLLDLSLSLPEGVNPVLGTLRTLAGTFFISIEDESTQAPLASVYVPDVDQYTTYSLDMDVDGYGYVTTGPGVAHDFYSMGVSALLAQETFTQLPATGPVFQLNVNGLTYDLGDVLRVALASDMLVAQFQDPNTIILNRNDDILNEGDREGLTDAADNTQAANQNGLIFRLGLARPDVNGNIDISVEGCIDNCQDAYKVIVPRGDTGLGEVGELPLDIYSPRTFLPGDPCAPSGISALSAVGGASGIDEACHEVDVREILDRLDDHAVGIVFAPASP
jgi:hypothetical protein